MTSTTGGSTRTRPPFSLKVAETKDEIESCYSIRIEVFAVEQGFPLDTELDEHDPTAVHFLLCIQESSPPESSTAVLSPFPSATATTSKPVGTIRLVPELGKLTRLAVLPEYRKYGFGAVLVDTLEEYVVAHAESHDELKRLIKVDESGAKSFQIKINSQLPVIPFYSRLGYAVEGDIFDEEGEPHRRMTKNLPL